MLFYQASNVFVRLSIQNPYKYLHDKKKLYKKVQTINRVKLLKTNEMRQNFFSMKKKRNTCADFQVLMITKVYFWMLMSSLTIGQFFKFMWSHWLVYDIGSHTFIHQWKLKIAYILRINRKILKWSIGVWS